MRNHLVKDGLMWGFLLWLFGYVLGFVFFTIVPHAILGWVIMPFGLVATIWVLMKKVSGPMDHYLKIAVVWTGIAVVADYFLLVRVLKPEDGYYKPDVYLYYTLMFLLPLLVGWRKHTKIA